MHHMHHMQDMHHSFLLWKELQNGFASWEGSAYAEWIQTYGSEEFEVIMMIMMMISVGYR